MLNAEQEAKLNHFIALDANWDGHNAPKLTPDSIVTFKNFFASIGKCNGDLELVSTVDNSFLSWSYEDEDVYLDTLFMPQNKANLYMYFKDDQNSFGLDGIELDELKRTLSKFAPVVFK